MKLGRVCKSGYAGGRDDVLRARNTARPDVMTNNKNGVKIELKL